MAMMQAAGSNPHHHESRRRCHAKGTTEQPSSIILSLSKERCAAGASKGEGCGLSYRMRRMLRGFALRPKHLSMRAVGVASLSNTGPTRNASRYEECLAMMQAVGSNPHHHEIA
ncbi:hypothetical protein A6R70_18915 [Agrobacterium rubi]|nr:hypothetical protein [Agrobacterium rubi]